MRGQALLYIKDLGKHDDTFLLSTLARFSYHELNNPTFSPNIAIWLFCNLIVCLEASVLMGQIQMLSLKKSAALELTIPLSTKDFSLQAGVKDVFIQLIGWLIISPSHSSSSSSNVSTSAIASGLSAPLL